MNSRILLPSQFEAQDLFETISGSFGRFEEVPDGVVFDFQNLRFVRPSGIVFLSNLTKYLARKGCNVVFENMQLGSQCIRFLDDSLFFQQHVGNKLNATSSPRVTTQPLVEVQHSESHDWVRNTFVPWLSDCSDIEQHDLSELATCLSELFNNIDDHTEYDVGSIFAQWYPQEERVIVSIADFGAGIPSTVGRVCSGLSDTNAIKKAFEDEFTSRSTPRNRGIGLYFLLQNVVQNLGGKLEVHSAGGAVIFKMVGDTLSIVPYNHNGFCPGTLIDIEFNTAAIERTEGELEDI